MKKIFALLTIAGMVFFYACAPAQQPEEAEEPEEVEEVVEEPAAEEVVQ